MGMNKYILSCIFITLCMLVGCVENGGDGAGIPVDDQNTETVANKKEFPTYRNTKSETPLSKLIQTQNNNVAQQDIFKDKIVWSGGNNNVMKKDDMHLIDGIYLYDLHTKKHKKIASTKVNGQTDETQMNGEWICWTDWLNPKGTDWTIYGYSMRDGKVHELDKAEKHSTLEITQLPRLALSNSNILVWIREELNEQGDMTRNLISYDLTKKQSKVISRIESPLALPSISDKYIVWSGSENIFVYSIVEDKIISKINLIEHAFPRVNNEYVVWNEDDNLMIQHIQSEEKYEIVDEEPFFYGIGQDIVVYQIDESIFAYHIQNRHTRKLSEKKATLPHIRNNDVVWQEINGKVTNLRVVSIHE
ncbi:hypothetical protein [Paenibacillus assamensis]|uniref:hypothetical protein n=1 Tax=Paenibacillus assamensis TaxID=311244 RepID=UPI0003FC2767|nr:hypothetical protein [Paenibacillus assamensis]